MKELLQKGEVKIIPALISFLMLLVFMAPLSKRIINIGNVFGIAVTGGLTVAFLLWGRTVGRIKSAWNSPAGRAFLCVCGGLAAVFVIYASVISVFMVSAARQQPKDGDATLIVLGCRARNGVPSRMLKRRLDAACDCLNENSSIKVIVSGGKGNDETVSEAEAMRNYLVAKGIVPERIYMEDKSVDTGQNLRYSKEIIEREGLSRNIAIVTDGYHQYRAGLIAKRLGMDTSAVSAHTSGYLLPTYWVREWFAIPYYYIKGKA